MAFPILFFVTGVVLIQVACYPRGDIEDPIIAIEWAPYIASIRGQDEDGVMVHRCGGSIIHEQFVLTAAHCMETNTPITQVLVGSADVMGEDGLFYDIFHTITHNKYNFNTLEYDVSLIKLKESLVFGPKVGKIYLPYDGLNLESSSYVTGWGFCASPNDVYPNLLQIHAPIIDDKTCNDVAGLKKVNITSNMMCAGNIDNSHNTCSLGETGGPLTIADVQFGIRAFSLGSCPGGISVYTKVESVMCWIMEHIVSLA